MSGLDIAANAAAWVILCVVIVDVTITLGEITGRFPPGMSNRWESVADLPCGIACLVMAMWHAWRRDWLMFAWFTVLSALLLRRWWHGRGKRRAAKVLAKVRDLGHRLTVVPATGGAS